VLKDDERGFGLVERGEPGFVLSGEFVGRVEESDAGAEAREHGGGFAGEDFGAFGEGEGCEIFANYFDGGAVFLDEDGSGRSAAQGFDAHGAGAGVCVDQNATGHLRTEHVEERFAQTIGSGARGDARQAFQAAAAKLPGDYSHSCPNPA
jgi:hypothetical protein